MFTDAHLSIPSRPYTHVYPHVRADTRIWQQTNADGAADAWVRVRIWASIHASMHKRRSRRIVHDGHATPARAHAHAHTRTLPWNLRAHSYIHMY